MFILQLQFLITVTHDSNELLRAFGRLFESYDEI